MTRQLKKKRTPSSKPVDLSLDQNPPLGILDSILIDLIDVRNELKKILVFSADELSAHRTHVMYVDRILDVLKARQQSKSVDRDQLLLESLKTVVRFLLEREETECARVLGDHLEEIGQKVKQAWNHSDSQQNLPGVLPESAPPSPDPFPPSPGKEARIKGNGGKEP